MHHAVLAHLVHEHAAAGNVDEQVSPYVRNMMNETGNVVDFSTGDGQQHASASVVIAAANVR